MSCLVNIIDAIISRRSPIAGSRATAGSDSDRIDYQVSSERPLKKRQISEKLFARKLACDQRQQHSQDSMLRRNNCRRQIILRGRFLELNVAVHRAVNVEIHLSLGWNQRAP